MFLVFEQQIDVPRLFVTLFFYARTGLAGDGYNPPAWYISALMIVSGFYFYMMIYFFIQGEVDFKCKRLENTHFHELIVQARLVLLHQIEVLVDI